MKKFRKLIPALCLLLISAMMLGTSTFAWFSMNTQVTATGMQVQAKSDNTYLLISSSKNTASEIQTEGVTTAALTISDAESKLYPSAPVISDGEVTLMSVGAGHYQVGGTDLIATAGAKVTNEATASVVTNWYTATAAASNAATMKDGSAQQLKSFTGYVIKKTVYLTVAVGSNPCENLSVTPTFTQKSTGNDITAARIIVTTSDGGFAVLNSTSGKTDIKGSNTALTDGTVLTVNIYVYYDGNDAKVYTNNAANLTGATMELAFAVEAKTGA